MQHKGRQEAESSGRTIKTNAIFKSLRRNRYRPSNYTVLCNSLCELVQTKNKNTNAQTSNFACRVGPVGTRHGRRAYLILSLGGSPAEATHNSLAVGTPLSWRLARQPPPRVLGL